MHPHIRWSQFLAHQVGVFFGHSVVSFLCPPGGRIFWTIAWAVIGAKKWAQKCDRPLGKKTGPQEQGSTVHPQTGGPIFCPPGGRIFWTTGACDVAELFACGLLRFWWRGLCAALLGSLSCSAGSFDLRAGSGLRALARAHVRSGLGSARGAGGVLRGGRLGLRFGVGVWVWIGCLGLRLGFGVGVWVCAWGLGCGWGLGLWLGFMFGFGLVVWGWV